jgi:hypothetical protein
MVIFMSQAGTGTSTQFKQSDEDDVTWNIDFSLGEYGSINFDVTIQSKLTYDPIYGIKPGDDVNLINEVGTNAITFSVVLSNMPISELEGTHSVTFNDALGTYSVPIPSASIDIPLLGSYGVYIDGTVSLLVNFTYTNDFSVQSSVNSLEYSESGTDSITLDIATSVADNEIVSITANYYLVLTDVVVRVKSDSSSVLDIPIDMIQPSWKSSNQLTIDVELGKTKSAPGFTTSLLLVSLIILGFKKKNRFKF